MQVPAIPTSSPRASQTRLGTQILSVVCAISGRGATLLPELLELHRHMAGINTPTELVLILNGCDNAATAALRTLATHNDRIQVYVMKYRVDHATALVAGLENAVG